MYGPFTEHKFNPVPPKHTDVNAKTNDNGETALMTAALNGHTAIINLLLEKAGAKE